MLPMLSFIVVRILPHGDLVLQWLKLSTNPVSVILSEAKDLKMFDV